MWHLKFIFLLFVISFLKHLLASFLLSVTTSPRKLREKGVHGVTVKSAPLKKAWQKKHEAVGPLPPQSGERNAGAQLTSPLVRFGTPAHGNTLQIHPLSCFFILWPWGWWPHIFFLWSRTYITHLIHCCCQYSYIKAFRITSCTTIFAIIYFSVALLKISWNQTNKQELIWVGDPTRKQMVFSKCYSLRKAYWYKGAVYRGISVGKQLSVWIAWVGKWFSEPEGRKQVEALLWEEPGPSVGLMPARSQDGDWHSLYGPVFWTRELTEEGTENLWEQILKQSSVFYVVVCVCT